MSCSERMLYLAAALTTRRSSSWKSLLGNLWGYTDQLSFKVTCSNGREDSDEPKLNLAEGDARVFLQEDGTANRRRDVRV